MSTRAFYTLDDLRSWSLIAAEMSPPARLAVIGDPVAHSRSPQMHNPALQARGLDAQYIRVQIPPGNVAEALRLFAQNGFLGINCTIPHKFEALRAVDHVDPLAVTLGAVNTVAVREGKRYGYNSDGPGFVNSATEAFGRSLEDMNVLIIGAGGGAGRAVAVQCALENCGGLVLMNRSVEKLESLARECREASPQVDISTQPWTDEGIAEVLPDVDLIVNATPLGMKEGDAPLLPASSLKPRHFVYDMVYRPSGDTPLIAAAKDASSMTCDGLSLLLHQGAISFGHWFGQPVPIEVMRRGLLGENA